MLVQIIENDTNIRKLKKKQTINPWSSNRNQIKYNVLLHQITFMFVGMLGDKVSKEAPEDFTTLVQNDLLHILPHMKVLWESTAKNMIPRKPAITNLKKSFA